MRWRFIVIVGVTLMVGFLVFILVTFSRRSVSPEDIRQFSRQFASLLGKGRHSVSECLLLAAQQTPNPYLRGVVLKIRSSAASSPLYKAMAQYPDVFSPEYVFAIEHGFRMAKVDMVLKQLSERWPEEAEKRWEVVHQIIKSLALESLNNPDWSVRAAALSALYELKAKDAIPHLLPLLNDPHPKVREVARKVLQKLGYQVSLIKARRVSLRG